MFETIPCILAAVVLLSTSARAQVPDTILHNARVFTSNFGQPWVEALPIRGDRVTAVDASHAMLQLAGANTRLIDLDGRTVGNIQAAVTHPVKPLEAVTREQAVIAYTAGSAYAERAEKEKGTLAPGMLADLAVLSHDIFTIPVTELPGVRSVLTMVGGKVVYEAVAVQ